MNLITARGSTVLDDVETVTGPGLAFEVVPLSARLSVPLGAGQVRVSSDLGQNVTVPTGVLVVLIVHLTDAAGVPLDLSDRPVVWSMTGPAGRVVARRASDDPSEITIVNRAGGVVHVHLGAGDVPPPGRAGAVYRHELTVEGPGGARSAMIGTIRMLRSGTDA
jgi:hypothetical protein